ncbi:hypothetical protein [Ureaplasma zalophigenitalium]|uniref:Uncharacterized protein n=1 Tax=Ureaplasma zalophigenitalium TaxID=907723 RepID=A0ABT3BPE7_9BACT|nr:hypothetical protein [Ureaplasma zalophigenitalium]MCV3754063.1 hypothetical protein [Ureaplasma zalophigenitalium]
MEKEIKTKLFIPILKIDLKLYFRKLVEINDLSKIIITMFLYEYKQHKELTIKKFLEKLLGYEREKLVDFVISETWKLIKSNVILYQGKKGFEELEKKDENAVIKSIKDLPLLALGSESNSDHPIHPTVAQNFEEDRMVGLEQKPLEKNYFYKRHLFYDKYNEILKFDDNSVYSKKENYHFLDPDKVLKNKYSDELYSFLKNYFENSDNYEGEYKIYEDYSLINEKDKNTSLSEEDISWVEQPFNFDLNKNEIIPKDEESKAFLSAIKEFKYNDEESPLFSIENIDQFVKKDILGMEIEKFQNEELGFKIENFSGLEDDLSLSFYQKIAQKQWSKFEDTLHSLINKKIMYDTTNDQYFYIFIREYPIKIGSNYLVNIFSFDRKEIKINELFNDYLDLKSEKYDDKTLSLIFDNIDNFLNEEEFINFLDINIKQDRSLEINWNQIIKILEKYETEISPNLLIRMISKAGSFNGDENQQKRHDLANLLVNKLNLSEEILFQVFLEMNFEYKENEFLFNKKTSFEKTINEFFTQYQKLLDASNIIENLEALDEEQCTQYEENISSLKEYQADLLKNFIKENHKLKDKIENCKNFSEKLQETYQSLKKGSMDLIKTKALNIREMIEKETNKPELAKLSSFLQQTYERNADLEELLQLVKWCNSWLHHNDNKKTLSLKEVKDKEERSKQLLKQIKKKKEEQK